MKKTKALALLSLLLACLLLLSACGSATYDELFRADVRADVGAETLTQIEELNDFVYMEGNEGFAFFRKKDTESGFFTYKVLSLHSERVVLTVTESQTVSYSFRTPSLRLGMLRCPVFFLITTTTAGEETYTLYDSVGTLLAPVDAAFAEDPVAFGDTMVYNGALYRQGATGKIERVRDISENLLLSTPDAANGNYYYYKTKNGITVYDTNFSLAAAWHVPSYYLGTNSTSFSYFVLNNGDVLIQYLESLHENAEEYNLLLLQSNTSVKYNLHSLLFSVKDNSTEELSLDYMVSSLTSEYKAKHLFEEGSYPYADGFENLAVILPIRDKHALTSEMQTVLLDNDGKIRSSLMLVDEQTTTLPERIGENLFLVETNYGRVITNAKGEILHTLNNSSLQIVGSYIVGERAIYNMSMEKVYDLVANNATVCGTLSNSIFIEKIDGRKVEIISFTEGKTQSAASYALGNDSFTILDELYRVEDATVLRYHYYTPRGKWLLVTAGRFERMIEGPSASLYCLSENGTATYYFLK